MSHIAPAPANPANAPSQRFFAGIGITPGMRVLDVGCGNGDLSRFVATQAGPAGEVVAIDRGEAGLTLARAADVDPDAAPIQYRGVNLADPMPDLGRFDAIVGRRVLMYLPDVAATLAALRSLAKPGAIIAFQEHARAGLPTGLSDLPLHRKFYDWTWSTVTAEGGDVALALRLADLLRTNGCTVSDARCEAILLQSDAPSFLPTLARAMLPRMVERGVTTAAEVDLDTLADRIKREHSAVGGTIVWDLAFLVAARVDAG